MKKMDKWERFQEIHRECLELAKEKDRLYGDLAIGALGGKGVFVRIWDKANRLKSLIWDGKEETSDEKVVDTLRDLINYATFAILVYEERL